MYCFVFSTIINPITQFSVYLQLIHRANITFEKFYFYSMVLVRCIITPLVIYLYILYSSFFPILEICIMISIFINYTSMTLFNNDWKRKLDP